MPQCLRILEVIIWSLGALLLSLNFAFPPWHDTTLLWHERVNTPTGEVWVEHRDPMPASHYRAKHWREFILGGKAREIANMGAIGMDPRLDWGYWFLCTLAIAAATLALTIPLRYWQRKFYGLRPGFEVLIGIKPPV